MSSKSNHQESIENWEYDHFLCFILLYASYADYEYSEDERLQILSQVDEKVLVDVERIFNTLGDYEQLDLILTHKRPKRFRLENKSTLLGAQGGTKWSKCKSNLCISK